MEIHNMNFMILIAVGLLPPFGPWSAFAGTGNSINSADLRTTVETTYVLKRKDNVKGIRAGIDCPNNVCPSGAEAEGYEKVPGDYTVRILDKTGAPVYSYRVGCDGGVGQFVCVLSDGARADEARANLQIVIDSAKEHHKKVIINPHAWTQKGVLTISGEDNN
ncbi:MAG: hypothetical protein ACXWP1_07140 [Bdellovibrionota bacterium]